MYGAILGDMIGCPFEFDEVTKSKEFPLFGRWSQYTDDTVLTVAIAEGIDYEDTVRNVVSLGGDTDITGAIAGSIAEAYFGIAEEFIEEGKKRLEPDMLEVINRFYKEILKQYK